MIVLIVEQGSKLIMQGPKYGVLLSDLLLPGSGHSSKQI